MSLYFYGRLAGKGLFAALQAREPIGACRPLFLVGFTIYGRNMLVCKLL